MTSEKTLIDHNLANAEWLKNKSTQTVFAAINQNGYEARAVGGAIRNTILGQKVKDIDIATNADPDTSMRLAQEAGLKVIPTGLQHGTITVVSENIPYEITTLRQDVETDGRRAKVSFTTDWKADASRRDFTMNALYVDASGNLYDPLNGYEDLKEKRVRFIGNPVDRIREDYLRILRYFRFKAEYGLDNLDQPSLHACVQEKDGLRQLSAERISAEITRLLVAPAALNVVQTMFSYGLLTDLLGTIANPATFANLLTLDKKLKHKASCMLRLAVLSLYLREDGERITKRLRLSNEQKKELLHILGEPSRLTDTLAELDAKELLYKLKSDTYQNKILYHWSLSGQTTENQSWKQLYNLPERWSAPTFPIKGRDLTEIGVNPGPEMGKLLKFLENIWIENDFSFSKNKLLKIACKRIKM